MQINALFSPFILKGYTIIVEHFNICLNTLNYNLKKEVHGKVRF